MALLFLTRTSAWSAGSASCPARSISSVALTRSTVLPWAVTAGVTRRLGRNLVTVKTQDDVIRVVDKIIYWIYRQASMGSMLPEQLDELEFDEFKKTIIQMIDG